MKISKLILIFPLLCLTSCSVIMAASGSKDPDFDKLVPGTDLQIVEAELGIPDNSVAMGSKVVNTYTYKVGDKASAGRAVGYFFLDLFTLCLWEYIGFPLEISNSGNAYQAQVTLNQAQKVVAVKKGLAP